MQDLRIGFGLFIVLAVAGLMPIRLNAISESDIPSYKLVQNAIRIDRWVILGPFKGKAGRQAYSTDFIKIFGCTETELSRPGAHLAAVAKGVVGSGPTVDLLNGFLIADLRRFYRLPFRTRNAGTAYLMCNAQSIDARPVWLCLNNEAPVRIWCNGREAEERRTGSGSSATRIDLVPGSNFLLLKIPDVGVDNEIGAQIAPGADLYSAFRQSSALQIVRRHIIDKGEPLEDVFNQICASDFPNLKVFGPNAELFAEVRPFDTPSTKVDWPEGLYKISLALPKATIDDVIYVRDRQEPSTVIEEIISGSTQDRYLQAQLNAQALRFRILIDGMRNAATRVTLTELEYKLGWTLRELYDQSLALRKNADPYTNASGLHLRSFISSVDGQAQHYRVYVPNRRSLKDPIPLVIILTPSLAGNPPYLASPIVARHESAEVDSSIAERLGTALLWPGCRISPFGNPIDHAHLDECLTDMRRHYNVDLHRIYLFSHSTAGVTGAIEAYRHPRRYAALAMNDPILHRTRHRYEASTVFDDLESYRLALKANDPFERLAACTSLPIQLFHDGSPDHGKLSESADFVTAARAHGTSVEFIQNNEVVTGWNAASAFEAQLNWLLSHSLKDSDYDYTSVNEDEGPISRVVSRRFVVVEPTHFSNPLERELARGLVAAFRVAWQNSNHCDCQVVRDTDVTEQIARDANLVLLGNADVNRIWSEMEDKLPIHLAPNYVRIRAQTWSGSFSIQAWCKGVGKYRGPIALIGAASLAEFAFPSLELSADGWYDYCISEAAETGPRIVAAGLY